MPRTALITGGTSGIGRAVAARFAADGAQVVVTGRHADTVELTAKELSASGAPCHGIVCDATDPAQVAALAARTDVLESVDVLVHAAGGLFNAPATQATSSTPDTSHTPHAPLERLLAEWQGNLAQNLLGTVLTTTALRDRLAAGASVISIGSIGAERGGGSYGAAKAALAAWNATLSAELAPHGVTANVIASGFVEGTAFFGGKLADERRAALIEETHNKRPGTPEDIAETTYFLASPGARHITGQTIHVNGGAHTTR
ncbi:SDR family NAD(P)-dependent oxidoreductase [Streptomyces sp. NPDC059009]|uniref:SDR family NAD(P)-dependent oxidoreductase n=1 Tax=Streptomyces sp. NPDC059009 TaxID=3346694 RepID=UPI0036A0A84C